MRMGRFFLLSIFLVVAAGLTLHFGFVIPYLPENIAQYVGHLPGDLIIKKEGLTVYVPLTTSLIASGGLSFVYALLFKRGK